MHDHPASPGNDQAARWNGAAGLAWVDAQPTLDAMFAPFEQRLAQAAAIDAPRRVLDVGCGTGATTLALARLARTSRDAFSDCLGIDISEPMIALARERASAGHVAARFVAADAQTYRFAPASFDLIQSRFGVMFFADPIAAFANLLDAAAPGATLRCIAWRAPAENAFMTTAERAAAPLLPELPAREPGAPGQFAFASRERVDAILRHAGWRDIAIHPLDLACTLPAGELASYAMQLGPVGLHLRETGADAATQARVADAMHAAFAPFIDGDTVRFDAACWHIEARAS